SLWMNMAYFTYPYGLTMTGGRFDALFGGPPREPETKLTQREMDLARSIQDITEEVMLKMAAFAHRETGMRDLCLAGGVALNCVGNGRILREGPFDGIWIQPAAGDAGGAVGVALALWHRYLGNRRASAESTGARAASRRAGRRHFAEIRGRHERLVSRSLILERRDWRVRSPNRLPRGSRRSRRARRPDRRPAGGRTSRRPAAGPDGIWSARAR